MILQDDVGRMTPRLRHKRLQLSSSMEWISRYKAVFGLFTLLAILVAVYIYTVGNEATAPTSLTFRTWPGQSSPQHLYDVIIQRTNKTMFGQARGGYMYDPQVKVTSPEAVVQPSPAKEPIVSEFGWIKNLNLSEMAGTTSAKESEISEENMILQPVKAKIHRRIAQLSLEKEADTDSFLEPLPGLPLPNKRKYLVYLCDRKTTCGGLGDRQRGIMGVFLLALVTRRRYGIRMLSPCELDNFFAPNKINWTVSESVLRLPFSDHINAMDDGELKKSLVEGDFNENHLEDVVFLRDNMDFTRPIIQHPKYKKLLPEWARSGSKSKVFGHVWNLLFKPFGSMKVKLDKAFEQINQTPHSKLVCAHVRIGRNPTIPGDQSNVNSIQSVRKLWKFLRGYEKETIYFIATDAERVRDMARREFGNKLLTVEGKIRHIDRQRDDRDACDGFETALLEQQILSKCDVLVLSQSGFSMFASYMRGTSRDLFIFNDGQITPFALP
ncbi:uncharacterized protein LOC124131243 isoform X2 [Haliotis rufescens]|uniref:uncharacterized protein LOC124131243 isoform X2 n=1 Tax=Haliotis rufescens TaxID=6454 RepID=UPI00201FB0F8|nr:uncharacterized protein LOC124131243 isoform X2 [Haliotis rufescens]XP_048251152.1 uncharacterized protein LOC124131243 isoform X2 [Haliotis rufescens]